MPEHRIRFRGGWEASHLGDEAGGPARISLPIVFEPGDGGPIRLTRRFGRPAVDEPVRLELLGVPGLRLLRVNGDDLGPIPVDVVDWTVPLGPLEPRNTLTLEVQPPEGMASPWGSIALVIGPEVGEGG